MPEPAFGQTMHSNYIPPLPMLSSGLPDALAAANSHVDRQMTTLQTVNVANKIAHERSKDAPIRALASQIVGNIRDAKNDVPLRVAQWIRSHVKYTQETPMYEILQGPYRTLGQITVPTPMGDFQFKGTGTGDCDDLSILFATLCRSVGVEAYVAGIAKRQRPESFFHAMGYCNGLFYELSLDGPYGGRGGAEIVSATPYPDTVAYIFDVPRSRSFRVPSGINSASPTSSGHMRMAATEPGPEPKIPPLKPLPDGNYPVNALQPSYNVPFNLYAPTRQISGISMAGSVAAGSSMLGGSLGSIGSNLGGAFSPVTGTGLQVDLNLPAKIPTIEFDPKPTEYSVADKKPAPISGEYKNPAATSVVKTPNFAKTFARPSGTIPDVSKTVVNAPKGVVNVPSTSSKEIAGAVPDALKQVPQQPKQPNKSGIPMPLLLGVAAGAAFLIFRNKA
jgi:hypothetical protein